MSASDSQRLAGRAALVTGAAGGIGRASALALARAGADIALNDLRFPDSSLAEEIESLGRRVVPLPADLSDADAVDRMVEQAVAELGRLDILVNSAVYSDREPFLTADLAGFRRTLDVSMWGAFHALRASARQMVKQGQGGAAVIVSSAHAHLAIPNCMAYNMAKAANDQMARTAALELLPHKIRVNLIYPGWTDTPGERKFFTEEVLARAARSLPMGRLIRPDEVARGVLFLVDPASEAVTGITLSIDGGSHLPWWSKRGTGEF
jgi:glucose 1-dehydrogenase